MGRPKEALRPCTIEVSPGTRHCRADRSHVIRPGDRCLVFHEDMRDKSYCLDCGRAILERGQVRIAALLAEVAAMDASAQATSGK